MANTLKTFTVRCLNCDGLIENRLPEAAMRPDAAPYSVECPHCGNESEILYDAATQIITLKAAESGKE
jgi:ribosomal protein S27E